MILPSKPCTYPGCTRFGSGGRCEFHQKQIRQRYYAEREEYQEWRRWIHSPRWRHETDAFKREHPLCERCDKEGVATPVKMVHHRIEHKGDYSLFWDQDNWESICHMHHEQEHQGERFGRGK